MYAKLFTSIYQGTLRGNSHGLLVFTNLLAHADQLGRVDVHPRAIAEEVGLTVEQVRAALDMLEAPDDESRSPECQGRRIVRLDEHRAWGWTVVNYLKYRAIRNEEDRREQNRESQRRYRERHKPASADVSQDKPQSAPSETSKPIQKQRQREKQVLSVPNGTDCPNRADGDGSDAPQQAYEVPPCPIEDIARAYHEVCPTLPKVAVLSEFRRGLVRQRWREVCAEERFSQAQGIEWFREFFGTVAASKFLTGRSPKVNGHDRAFHADFEWLVRPQNFVKVVEGKYL